MADPELLLLLGARVSVLTFLLLTMRVGLGLACYYYHCGPFRGAVRGTIGRGPAKIDASAVRGAGVNEAKPEVSPAEPKCTLGRASVEVTQHPRVVFITPGGLCYHVQKQGAGLRSVVRDPAHRRACTMCCSLQDEPSHGTDSGLP